MIAEMTTAQLRDRIYEDEQGRRRLRGTFHFKHFNKDGVQVDEWEMENIVVNVGLDDALDVWLSGAAQDTTWFIGLKGTGTPVAADTMASHASWTEDQNYTEGTREAWVDGGVSAQSVDNVASPAAFSMNATTTIHGAFLCGDGTKGGTAGILAAVGDFPSSKAMSNLETLQVTYTITSADDGV